MQETTVIKALPLSQAHEKSRCAVIDPVYDAVSFSPGPDIKENFVPWIYGESELECWRLQLLIRRMKAAELKVGYPGTFHEPSTQASFHLKIPFGRPLPAVMKLRAVGDVIVSLRDRVLYHETAREEPHVIELPESSPDEVTLRVDISAQDEPPALLIENGPFATERAEWRCAIAGVKPAPVRAFPQTCSGVPPHRLELQEIPLKPKGREDDLVDFGCELLGRVTFRCAGRPVLYVGESPAEARNSDPGNFEQSTALKTAGDDRWISEHALAFRYLRIIGGEPADIECLAQFHPARYRGAFACSDERLTRIWMNSAYTLRLCLHDFLIDGIKRDRLPWTGDLAMSLMANACTFGDGEIVRRTLTALGRAGIATTDINGIVDYSMWWIIAQKQYQLYFGDSAHLELEWLRIKETLQRLAERCKANGLIHVTSREWLFIDWVDDHKLTALQILWWWAQSSGADLAARMGDNVAADHWKRNAGLTAKTLQSGAWNQQAGWWRGCPDKASGPSRHANILAIVSGLAQADQYDTIREVLLGAQAKPVGTPYMAGFENIALGLVGATDAMVDRTNAYWGGMLDRGASTFWEAYDPVQEDDRAYAFYGRPFAKSLCHAWSSGPAAFLISGIFGLRPCADGWSQFTIEPQLGSKLSRACATVPTPAGDIEISIESQHMTLNLPAGVTARWRDHAFSGPGRFSRDL